MKELVLGAGFSGMAAGIKTGSPIFEISDHAGGICTDYVKEGFRFSNGGPHYLFGKDKGLEYIKSLVEVKEYEANAGVYFNHTFPYPLQAYAQKTKLFNNIPGLPMGYHHYSNFGKELYNLFFEPFNEKYTAGLYGDIIPQDAYKTPVDGKKWVSTFCDPVNGLSDLVSKMSSKCIINYNHYATSIDTHNKLVKFDNGWIYQYDRLISTIPLNKLMQLCGQECNLPYTSVLVVNIGAEPWRTPKEHWLYIPFCDTGFHRVAFYTNVDKTKAPEGMVGLSVELAFRENLDFEQKAKEIISELQEWGWIGEVITYSIDIVPCAYTWQYNREDVPNALAWLKERDIESIGRYGKWSFQGLTKSIEDGFNV